VVTLVLAAALAAQTPAPSPSPTPRVPVIGVTVGLVQVDAVVTDDKGRHVTDLGPADFVLKEEGQVQEIAQVSYVALAPALRHVIDSAGTPAPQPSAGAAPPRLITLVVDDLNLSFESTIRLKDTLRTFVAETLTPSDRVALLRTGGGVGTMQQFTTDRRALRAAIDRLRFNPMGAGHIGPDEALETEMPFGGGPQGASPSGRASRLEAMHNLDRFREQLVAIGTMGTVRSVVRALAPLPGRKAVVVFSDGLPAFDSKQEGRIERSLSSVTDEANRASVTLYTIDTRGLFNPGLRAMDNVASDGAAISRLLDRRNSETREAREGLRNLADRTGGFMITNSNDLAGAIRTVVQDQQGYYLIGYVPPASALETAPGARRFHKLDVSVRRPGLRVRSRSGFYGVPDAAAPPPPTTREARMREALQSPFAAAEMPLRLQTVFLDDEKAGPSLRALLHVDGKDITFGDPAVAGEPRQATLDVVAVTFAETGDPVDQKNQTFTIKAAPGADHMPEGAGVFYSVDLPVKRPGAYQFRVIVRDVGSDRLGSASQFVDVPDLKKSRLALSGIVVRGTGEGSAAPLAAETLVGRVRAGTNVEYVFQVLNARRHAATKRTQLTVGARLWRGRELLYDGPPAPLSVEPADPARVAAGGRLSLSSRLPAGDYALEVTVTDALAGRGKNVATQWTDLEVVAQ
jgi:VWFA-related protein